MLWDLIRNFFVQYVFGGYTSDFDTYDGFLGYLQDNTLTNGGYVYSTQLYLPIKGVYSGDFDGGLEYGLNITIGDWLSTTATIITLCLLVAFLFLVVRWLFKLVSGLITLRG